MSKQYPGGIVSKTPVTPTSLSAPGIWTMNQQAAAQATNTWPFPRDPQFKNVTMLLHGDGAAGPVAATGVGAGVSSTVTNFNADASTNNFNVTINGDARSDNFTPYQEGYYSNYFAGTSGQYLNAPANAAFSFGTGDFTVEGWVYPTSTSGTRPIVEIRTTGGATGFAFLSQSGASTLNVYTNSAFVGASTNSLTLNAWSHVALVRSGNTWTYWINGVSSGSFTNTSTQSDGATTGPKIGGSTTAGEVWVGYLSNIRIIKGTAVYTSAFTPSTTPLTAISGTSLLTCQSNRFIDNSSNAFTITVNGSPQVSPAQPFTLPSSVATYGSGYFDGTGDWLQTPSNSAFNFSATDCTLEFWYYGAGASGLVFEFGSSTPDTAAMQCEFSSGTLTFKPIGASSSFFAIQANAWNYIAAVKTGTTYYLYINGTRNTASTGTAASTGQIINIGARNGGSTAPITGYLSDFRVSNTARYTGTTMTVPTTPLTAIANTQLLIAQYNGGGNNSGFEDNGPFNFPITRNGNTTQGTFTPYAADWSNYLNGSSNFTAGTTASNFLCTGSATGITATFEAWVYPTAYSTGGSSYLYSGIHTKGTTYFNFGIRDGAVRFYWYDGAQKYVDSASTSDVPLNTWTHIALTISGSTIKIYINGVLSTTSATYTGVQSGGSGNTEYIGKENNGYYVNGYVSNYRLTNTVVYSAAFTPSTTPLTAVTGTQLLTCQSNRFIDNSSNAFTVTAVSAPSVQGFSPFAPLAVYNPTTYGGSAYFDGSGDTLSLASQPALNFGTGDFTLEAWVYATTTLGDATCIFSAVTNGGMMFGTNGVAGSGVWAIGRKNTAWDYSSSTVPALNQWQHVAVCRSGTSVRIFINGVQSGTTGTNSTAYDLSLGGTVIGYQVSYMNGYFSSIRATKTALYTAAFTPPSVPLTAVSGTSLLVSTTNPAILDNAMLNNLETVGNASVSTAVKKYGAASIYLDGTGDYLLARSNDVFNFGTGDFTIEFWINASATGTYNQVVGTLVSGTEAGTWRVGNRYASANTVYFSRGNGSGFDDLTASVNVNDGSWHHVAVTRASGTVRIFVDGTLATSVTNTGTCTSSNALYVGYNGRDNAYVTGYIDDLRITKGVARYTATFTVPDQAFPNG